MYVGQISNWGNCLKEKGIHMQQQQSSSSNSNSIHRINNNNNGNRKKVRKHSQKSGIKSNILWSCPHRSFTTQTKRAWKRNEYNEWLLVALMIKMGWPDSLMPNDWSLNELYPLFLSATSATFFLFIPFAGIFHFILLRMIFANRLITCAQCWNKSCCFCCFRKYKNTSTMINSFNQ